jgi:predicted GNAT family acetyltransferase
MVKIFYPLEILRKKRVRSQNLAGLNSYSAGHFVLGFLDDVLVATAALIPESETSMRIVRMSVDREYRRRGIAT